MKTYWKTRQPLQKSASILLQSVDWSGQDSPVKNQWSCGSCWAFAAVALVENIGSQDDLSEQAAIACSDGDCAHGGWYGDVLAYIYDDGIPPEDCYPYAAVDGSCINACPYPDFRERITSYNYSGLWGDPTSVTVNLLKACLQTGPVVVSMLVPDDGTFDAYSGGVYDYHGGSISESNGHAVLVVGYNDDAGCFKAKNSWGKNWGENGYFLIAYNDVTDDVRFGGYACMASGPYTEYASPALAVSPVVWSAPAAGGISSAIQVASSETTINFSVESNNADWLTASISNGSTPGSFTLTASANNTGSSRTGTVTVTATSPPGVTDSPQTVTVTQPSQPPPPSLAVNASSWDAPANGGMSPAFQVTSSGAVIGYSVVSNNPDWLTASVSSGSTPGSFTLTVSANNTGLSRTGTVTVTATSPSGVTHSPRTITVSQFSNPRLAVGADAWTAPVEGGSSSEIQVTNTSGDGVIAFTVASDQSTWLFISAERGETPSGFVLTAAANHSRTARTGTVTVSAMSPLGVMNSPRTIAVSQAANGGSIRPAAPDSALTGTDFWVDVRLGDPDTVINLFAASFELSYPNTGAIEFAGAEAGPFLGSDLVFLSTPDAANGKVSVGVSRKSPMPGVNGSGIAVRMKFYALSDTPEGTSILFSLANVTAMEPDGSPINLIRLPLDTTVILTGYPVWPGDANNDGIVNQADVLPMGLNWNRTGPIRPDHSNVWTAQVCQTWAPQNATYADANGDGKVNQADILPIGSNWGRTRSNLSLHADSPADSNAASSAYVMRTEISTSSQNGSESVVDLFIGDEVDPVNDLYGLSFVMNVKSSAGDPIIKEITPGERWGGDILSYSRIDPETGAVHCGLTRKPGQEESAATGPVARIVVRSIHPVDPTVITVQDISANDSKGNPIRILAEDDLSSVDDARSSAVPSEFVLYQNRPNPFNPSTAIRYALPRASRLTLKVYDGLGREVRTLVEDLQNAGEHEIIFNANGMTSGLYYCRLQTGRVVLTRKLLLLK